MDFLDGLNAPDVGFLGLNFVFKLLFFVILTGYIFYAFLILIRVRILSDTVKTKHSGLVKGMTYIHMLVALVGGFLALILILLA